MLGALMAYPPQVITGHGAEQMKLICYAKLESGERRVAGASLAGIGPREECGIAIFESSDGFYLFTCDSDWRVMWDSWSADLEWACHQAESAYPGISSRWKAG